MTAGLRFDRYRWAGGEEAMLRIGPARAPTVIVALPLFEEANRTRATAVAMLRLLAQREIGGALPDLPGTGESLVPTRDARLADWQAAFASGATTLPGPVHVAAIRGGALIDTGADAASRWHLSPMTGADQARELRRLHALSGDNHIAGNDLAPGLLALMECAEPARHEQLRTVRLDGDPRAADVALPYAPPWRRAEPQRDEALAAALADDLAQWIASCGG